MSEKRIVLDKENLETLLVAGRKGVIGTLNKHLDNETDLVAIRDYYFMIKGAEIVFDSLDEVAARMPTGILVDPPLTHIPYLDN